MSDLDIVPEYLELLDALKLVCEANKGLPAGDDDRILDADTLALKCFVHAASTLYLSRSTKVAESGADFCVFRSIPIAHFG